MSNLLATSEGRGAMIIAQRFLLQERLSRFFKRNNVVEIEKYRNGGVYDISGLLGDLNAANDDEILDIYRLLGAVGGLEESAIDVTYYVNGTTGDDLTGDGSATSPYQTMWFLPFLPKRINHQYRILLSGTINMATDDIVIDTTFGGADGCLSIIGTDAPAVQSSNHTVSAVNTLAGSAGLAIDFAPAFAIAHDDEFLQVTSATDPDMVGRTTPICANVDLDTVFTKRLPLLTVAPGDIFRVVRPVSTLIVRSLSIECQGSTDYLLSDLLSSRVNIVNLIVNPFGGGTSKGIVNIDSKCDVLWSFSEMSVSGTLIKSRLNTTRSVDTQLESLSNSGVTNLVDGSTGIQITCGVVETQGAIPQITTTYVEGLGFLCHWQTQGAVALSSNNGGFKWSYCGSVLSQDAITLLQDILAYGFNGSPDDYALKFLNSRASVSFVSIIEPENIVVSDQNAQITLNTVQRDGTYSTVAGYGIYIIGISSIQLDTDPTNLTGTTGDIDFETTSPATVVAHPAVSSAQTDSQGSFVKRLAL
jgi:hypothetical protein